MDTPTTPNDKARRLRGGPWGPILVMILTLLVIGTVYGIYVYPSQARGYGEELAFDKAMFFDKLPQPIAFSHRVHVTDKAIDCAYCHPFAEYSLNAGLPTVETCLGCHDHIIPEHDEILQLKGYQAAGMELPWVRVYYNPDHVYFPHYRHLAKGVECQQCHGDVQEVDMLNKVTFYMGFCLKCHDEMGASRDCGACHQ